MKRSKKQHKQIHMVAATVFGIGTFIHALRLAMGWPVIIGDMHLTPIVSWILVLVGGSLAVLMWQSAKE